MLRGEKPITEILSEQSQPASSKGKRGVHLDRRDQALACRFYYYFTIMGFRYEVCVTKLINEFFLTDNTITGLLANQQEYLKQLKTKNADLKYLREEWPHYRWN